MSETGGLGETIGEWNENSRLCLWGGVISAIISWLLIPLFGLVAVFCGYKLYDDGGRTAAAALIAGVGAIGFLTWVVFLVTFI
ncbi:MAG: hypothetical protein IH933_04360 [Euryarchaeota archaeon]|nr:hypothetical protein [Euryarchaeota archaeon]